MRLVFMGTPDFSVPTLAALVGQGHEIAAVYTRAPKPAGRRGLELQPSPVQVAAERFGLPVLTPKTLRDDEAQAVFASHGAEVCVVVAYGLILPKAVLAAPARGCLNVHASLLPRWRGAAPIQRAVMAGDAETGVMIMGMEEGLDTGPIAMAERVSITPSTTAGDLHGFLGRIGADLAVRALAALSRDALTFVAQPTEGVTYAHKIEKAESRIDFTRSAGDVRNQIHGLSPFPGAWCEGDLGRGLERLKILRAQTIERQGVPGEWIGDAIACGTDAIVPVEVQRAGRAPLPFGEFARGAEIAAGTVFH
jgi:methionyl-tRNA formyltransferase